MHIGSNAFYRIFEESFATGERSFDADYLLFASRGAFVLENKRRQWLLPPQRAALIACGTSISVSSKGPATSSSILFRNDELGLTEGELRVFVMSDLARLMVAQAMRWGGATEPSNDQAHFFHALASVVAELSLIQLNTWLPRPSSSGLAKAIAVGLADLGRNIGFGQLAQSGAVSERTLARLFRRELGMTWTEFRHRARMIKAMEALAQESVTEAGFQVGFESTSAFIRAFKAFSGQTPNAFKRSVVNSPRHARSP
ncbi:helix-turn-helix transcriptional regulator [Devosia rhodophyticola]|uniref:Helix-turn-helix transcriptional regulator n=1 Tax=Devosia rhodophyticola TaxID=3026423 RepID=A0ABY7YWC0_9HYPH|nr:helix-turn-helix transcriptional regulator [Devosia rhodophyticola]WDR05350.1 helix-turn-helix transcriptional regulator [Devosia rhodophyticola]